MSGKLSDQTTVLLVASGDLRLSANQVCWPAQKALEKALTHALAEQGVMVKRAHPYKPKVKHGFIASQREGIEIFRDLDPDAPLIVAEAVWQYSHHILPGLTTHRGVVLTVANWIGQWPGLRGRLNIRPTTSKSTIQTTPKPPTRVFFPKPPRSESKSPSAAHSVLD